MSDQEANALFSIASSFAARTYVELYCHQPDTSQEATNQLLNTLMQAWLTGYNYLRQDCQLVGAIREVFNFYVESD